MMVIVMVVKVDKYYVVDGGNRENHVCIIDQTKIFDRTIVEFATSSKEVNMLLANLVLDELNTGKYELEFLDKGDD